MKTILMAASALSLLAAPALAQESSTVTVNGSVALQCGVGNGSGGGDGAPSVVTITEMTDADGFLSIPAQAIEFGNIWCNGAGASMTLAVSALQHDTIADGTFDASSFINKVNMHVETGNILAYFGGGAAHTGAPLTATSAGAFETGQDAWDNASLTFSNPSGNDRPLAGSYSGSVVLTVSPS